jgi:hypothetical protein
MGTEFGPMDCVDCGGSGKVPDRNVLADWRIRDIERAMSGGVRVAVADLQWLIRELRTARTALTGVVALAHDVPDDQGLGMRIRRTAQYALGVRARPDPAGQGPDSNPPASKE